MPCDTLNSKPSPTCPHRLPLSRHLPHALSASEVPQLVAEPQAQKDVGREHSIRAGSKGQNQPQTNGRNLPPAVAQGAVGHLKFGFIMLNPDAVKASETPGLNALQAALELSLSC